MRDGPDSCSRGPASRVNRRRVHYFALKVLACRVGYIADCLTVEHYLDGSACVPARSLRRGRVVAGHVTDYPAGLLSFSSLQLKYKDVRCFKSMSEYREKAGLCNIALKGGLSCREDLAGKLESFLFKPPPPPLQV